MRHQKRYPRCVIRRDIRNASLEEISEMRDHKGYLKCFIRRDIRNASSEEVSPLKIAILFFIFWQIVWPSRNHWFSIFFVSSNITAAPAYGVYISQLIWYSWACGSCQDFLDINVLLTKKILNQWFLLVMLKSSLCRFFPCHHDLVNR